MQKKIIALAIAGLSSAAFAQSNVTISGIADYGYYSQSIQTGSIMDTKTSAAGNGSATSQLNFTITEKLGNGMSVKFFGETDFAAASGASGTNLGGIGLFNSTNWLELSGGFGSLKAGNINTAGLYAEIGAQPFGTAIGSGISGTFGRLSRAGINGKMADGTAGLGGLAEGQYVASAAAAVAAGARSVRVANSLSYTTPSFSGFTAGLQWAAKNSDSAVAAAGNTAGFVAVNAQYNNGPVNVYYVNEQYSAGSVAPQGGISSTTAGMQLLANEKVTHNMLTGNYTFGPATVYAGWTSSKSSGTATTMADARSWNLGLKYQVMGSLSLAANILKVDDKLAGNQDRNLNAIGFDYDLSKRSAVYGRYETGDNDRADSANGNFSRYQVGLRHSF
jgi:predicted porin